MGTLVELRKQTEEKLEKLMGSYDLLIQTSSAAENARLECTHFGAANVENQDRFQKLRQHSEELSLTVSRYFEALMQLERAYLGAVRRTMGQLGEGLRHGWVEQKRLEALRLRHGQPDIQPLAKHFQDLVGHAFALWRQLKKLSNLPFHNAVMVNEVVGLFDEARSLLHSTLQSSFVVTREPPLVYKSRVDVSVRLLGGRRELGLEGQTPSVTAKLIPEDTAQKILHGSVNPASPALVFERKGFEEQDQKVKDLESKDGDCYGADFCKAKLKVGNRRGGAVRGGAAAIRNKYHILFYTNVTLDSGTSFPLYTLSQPFVYSVHGNQDLELWGSIIWDVAFPVEWGAAPLRGREEVGWEELERVLPGAFSLVSATRKSLSESDVAYLRSRFLPHHPPTEAFVVKRQAFFKEPLYYIQPDGSPRDPLSFSFWDWFFGVANLIAMKTSETKLPQMWDGDLLFGFASKAVASEAVLREGASGAGAFLLRFSENQLAAISVATTMVTEDGGLDAQHLRPFRAKTEIDKFKMPDLIKSVEELADITLLLGREGARRKKEDIVQLGIRTKREDEAPTPSQDYKDWSLHISADGKKPSKRRGGAMGALGSPQAHGRMSVDSQWTASNVGSPSTQASIDCDFTLGLIDSHDLSGGYDSPHSAYSAQQPSTTPLPVNSPPQQLDQHFQHAASIQPSAQSPVYQPIHYSSPLPPPLSH